MFKNLTAEIARTGLSKETLAEALNIPVKALIQKLSGENDFCLDECLKIQSVLKNNLALEYLFECD